MMAKTKKNIGVLLIALAAWFMIADAYWMSKERVVAKCSLDKASELVKQNLIGSNIYDGLIDATALYDTQCSYAMGAGNYWRTPKGMAYWEIVLLLPVINRFGFSM